MVKVYLLKCDSTFIVQAYLLMCDSTCHSTDLFFWSMTGTVTFIEKLLFIVYLMGACSNKIASGKVVLWMMMNVLNDCDESFEWLLIVTIHSMVVVTVKGWCQQPNFYDVVEMGLIIMTWSLPSLSPKAQILTVKAQIYSPQI